MITINTLRNRKAISPVIATVILVAVAISVSVAVSYWMGSIAGQYTSFEKIEMQSGYATRLFYAPEVPADPGAEPPTPLIPAILDGWKITIKLKNTGSAPATITSCFINEKPIEEYTYGTALNAITMAPPEGVTLESGTTAIIYVTIEQAGVTFTSGTTINVKMHSAGGMDYIKLVKLT